jgi:hypothetical protein
MKSLVPLATQWIQSTTSHAKFVRTILKLSSCLRVCFPDGLFPHISEQNFVIRVYYLSFAKKGRSIRNTDASCVSCMKFVKVGVGSLQLNPP